MSRKVHQLMYDENGYHLAGVARYMVIDKGLNPQPWEVVEEADEHAAGALNVEHDLDLNETPQLMRAIEIEIAKAKLERQTVGRDQRASARQARSGNTSGPGMSAKALHDLMMARLNYTS